MAIGRITYEDKIDSSVNEQDPKYKITAQDMNEIKQVFNESAEDIEFATGNLGDYKVENGVIYFKKADGSYNEQGITLAGQSSVLDGNGNVILSGNITPNDNLLTNSDFKSGIINQKGETSYAYVDKALLTIDGWISYGVNVGLDADSIRIINRQTSNRTLRQYVEGKSGTYTVYVNVKSITGNVYVNFNQDISKNKKLVKGKNIFQITLSSSENLSSFTLLLEANAYIYIHCMKLETGEHFTGMPAWNEALELLKSYKKYYAFNAQPNTNNNKYMFAVQIATNKARITFDVPVQIDKTPSVKFGYLYIVNIATGGWHLVTTLLSINYVANKITLEFQTQDNISSSVNSPVYAMFTKDGYLSVDMNDY